MHCSELHKSVIQLGLIQHSAQIDYHLCINSHIIHVSLLKTSVFWQEKEDFDGGPLGFSDNSSESGITSLWREWLQQDLSFTKWGELLLSTHILHPVMSHTHIPLEACIKSYSTIWCWYTAVCGEMPRAIHQWIFWTLTISKAISTYIWPFILALNDITQINELTLHLNHTFCTNV